jgi:hypothetical protein
LLSPPGFPWPSQSGRLPSPQFSFDGTFQNLLLFGRKIGSFVFLVERHEPDLLVGLELVVDDPEAASSSFAAP